MRIRPLIARAVRAIAPDLTGSRERPAATAVDELVDRGSDMARKPAWVAVYEAGVAACRDRRLVEAIACFATVDALRGGDPLSRLMIERCNRLIASPPPPAWTAVTVIDGRPSRKRIPHEADSQPAFPPRQRA